MGEWTDKIVDLKDSKKTKEIRDKINELRKTNTELRRKTKNKGLPINVRDDLFMQIEDNEIMIEDLLKEMKSPTIVPVTGTSTVAEHVYEDTSNFRSNSFRF